MAETHKGFGLLFEMGCGKTLTAIMIAGTAYQMGKVEKVLVVAPTSVCSVWPKDFAEFADFKANIKVLLGDKNRRLKLLNDLDNFPFKALKVAVINYESTWREGIFDALYEANKGDTTMSVTMTRANRKIIATSCVTIKGFGKLDGKYYVEKVTWDIGSGCKQKLDLRRVADRFTDAKSSTKSVAKKSKTETKSSTATTTATKSTETQTPVKGGKYTLTTTKKGYYTAAEALAGKVTGGHPTGTRRPGTYTIFNISQGMLNLTTKAGVPGSWINPN